MADYAVGDKVEVQVSAALVGDAGPPGGPATAHPSVSSYSSIASGEFDPWLPATIREIRADGHCVVELDNPRMLGEHVWAAPPDKIRRRDSTP